MTIHLYRAWMFVKRGVLIWTGYRTALLIGLVSSVVSLVQFGWTARFVARGNAFPLLEVYGGDLVAYFLIGSAFTAFVTVTLNAFHENIRAEQQMGTLESLFLADLSPVLLAVYLALWPFVHTLLDVTLLFLLVVLLFHVPLRVHPLTVAVILFLTAVALAGIGLMSAGVVLVTKRGDPVHWVFTTLTALLGGVFYPVQSLPAPFRPLALLLPTTHALHALRLGLLRAASLAALRVEVMVLALTCALTVPAGVLALRLGWQWARRAGTLAEY